MLWLCYIVYSKLVYVLILHALRSWPILLHVRNSHAHLWEYTPSDSILS